MLEVALELVGRGWAVHPLKARDKVPLSAHGAKDATTDPARVRGWWSATPGANVGVATGRASGHFVLDIDGAEGARSLADLEVQHGVLPLTLRVSTGRDDYSCHMYFELPDDRIVTNSARRLGEGLDVRGEGGYVVGPGSVHPSGRAYTIACDAPVAKAPDWLVDLVAPLEEPARPASERRRARVERNELAARQRGGLESALEKLRRAQPGGRNELLNEQAYFLAGLELGQADIAAALWEVCSGWVGEPKHKPFTRHEFDRTVGSAYRGGRAKVMAPRPNPRGRGARAPEPESEGQRSRQERRQESRRKPPDWHERLARTRTMLLKGSAGNAITILEEDKRLEGVLAWSEFEGGPFAMQRPPWAPRNDAGRYPRPLEDVDATFASRWLQEEYEGTEFAIGTVHQALDAAAKSSRRWHPVREYLEGLEWDGTERAAFWLEDFWGVDGSAYGRAVALRWLVSAVARIFEPGCKVDTVLVLEGHQGLYKSEGVKALVGNDAWFKDESLALRDTQEMGIALSGVWVWELAELSGMRSTTVEALKAAITRSVDRYRPKWGRRSIAQPRTTVFIGTTNDEEYLEDTTGNRRFWPVRCKQKADLERIRASRAQLWAEAVHLYKAGQRWWLDTDELEAEASAETEARRVVHPWEEALREWAECKVSMTTREALLRLGFQEHQMDRSQAMRVAAVIRGLGFTEKQRGRVGAEREWVYRKPQAQQSFGLG